jgi:hypothetical protein
MVYFKSPMTREDVIELIGQVDSNVFSLWQDNKENNVYGVVKDSGYEFFIGGCSLFIVRHMEYLTREQAAQTLADGETTVICGNFNLMG